MRDLSCAVDIGGTKLSVGLVKSDGQIIDQTTIHAHVNKIPDLIIKQIVEIIMELLKKHSLTQFDLAGLGLATAGYLRYSEGILITMSNLYGFENYPIKEKLKEYFSIPIEVDNDANAQALAEFYFGSAKGYKDVIFMTISTQIGAGIILDGKLYRGLTGTAGEIGHTIIDPNSEEICPCGNRGCLISLASGRAIPNTIRRKLKEGFTSTLISKENIDSLTLDGNLIQKGLAIGDPICQSLLEDFACYLGMGVYNVFQIFNPDVVVLGGGITHWGKTLFEGIERNFKSLARNMIFDPMPILPGLVDNSGLVGASLLLKNLNAR